MLNYVRQFIKIRVVFHTLYIWNEDGDPPIFLAFLAQVTHYLTAVKILKKSIEWQIFARTSLTDVDGTRFT